MKIFTPQRFVALSTLAVLSATLLAGPSVAPVQADSKTWKKVAIGAGAVTAYGLVKGKGKVATIGGLATAGSYLKYRSDKKKENNRAQARRNSRYRSARQQSNRRYRR
ncbi:hypothetical protein EON80_20610 [bacterium]|nr:MAG: hypothetical protein EON80_20610 [bacterium]